MLTEMLKEHFFGWNEIVMLKKKNTVHSVKVSSSPDSPLLFAIF